MIAITFWVSVAMVVYTYAGYPLLITLFARLRPAPRHRPHLPTVSLIVAAYDEEASIGGQLDRLRQLDYPVDRLQVIVAADGSTDATADIVRRHRWALLVHRPQRAGKMAALQRALGQATGEVVVTTDANTTLHPDALRLLVEPFADPRVGAVTGRKIVRGPGGMGSGEGMYWRYESHIRRMETRLGCTVGVNGELFAIRTNLFAAAPPGTINDDQWLAQQAILGGWNVVFRPDAVSEEVVSATAAEEAERRSRMVAGQLQVFSGLHRQIPWRRPLVAWMLVSHKMLRPLVPIGLVGALVAAALAAAIRPRGGLAALGEPWGLVTLLLQAAFYAAAAAGERMPRLGGLGWLPRFLVVQNLATVRGLWRHLRGTQQATWRRADRSAA